MVLCSLQIAWGKVLRQEYDSDILINDVLWKLRIKNSIIFFLSVDFY